VGFMMARFVKPFLNVLKAGSFFASEQPKFYFASFPSAIHQDLNVIAEDSLSSPDVIDKAELYESSSIRINRSRAK